MRKFFEGKHHAALYAKYRPEMPSTIVDRILAFMKKRNSDFKSVVDVGCGNGQSTRGFAPHFSKVLGIDTSCSQISEATQENQIKNVKFEVGDGEKIPLPDNSVDLVSTCMAAHWFDLPVFFKECTRVLKHNGSMLICAYTDPIFYPKSSDGKPTQADYLKLGKTAFQNLLHKYSFHERTSHLYNNYNDIFDILNAKEKVHEKDIELKKEMSLENLLYYLSTWSPYQNLVQEQKEKNVETEDVLDVFAAELKRNWNMTETDNDKISLCVVWYNFMIMSDRPVENTP